MDVQDGAVRLLESLPIGYLRLGSDWTVVGGDLDEGMARLHAAATELAGSSLDDLCEELLERLVDGHPEDDVALVAIRLRS